MDTMRIHILDPKAAGLLKDLADRKLIEIQDGPKDRWMAILEKLRSKASSAPTLEEITSEVESVRAKRHARKAPKNHH